MRDEFKRLKGANPQVFEALNSYFRRELDNVLLKLLACEETNRLNFLRGVGSAYLKIVNDMLDMEETKTKVKV